MTVRIEFDEAVQLLREIVAEKGEDYVYEDPDGVRAGDGGYASCVYFAPATGKPSCIVGHVLARKGVTLDTEGFGNSNNVYGLVEQDGFLDVDGETYDLLRTVQDGQDGGAPWGVALESALHG